MQLTSNTSNNNIFICSFPLKQDLISLLFWEMRVFFTVKKWPIKKLTELEILGKIIVAEIKIKRKKIFFVPSYRHPNQTLDEVNLMQNLETFMKLLTKKTMQPPSFVGTIMPHQLSFGKMAYWEGRIFRAHLKSGIFFVLVRQSFQILTVPTKVVSQ